MRRAAAALAVGLALPAAAAAQAPVAPPPPVAAPASPILTIDQDALYRDSAWGRRAQAELEARGNALAAENDRIVADLEAQDDALTALRESLPPEEFRARAEAFDAHVQETRRERDLAARALLAEADADRTAFLRAVLPVFGAVMAERGALVVLDRRTVFLSADAIDITGAMIARIDATIGDRPRPPAPGEAGEPDAAPEGPESDGGNGSPGFVPEAPGGAPPEGNPASEGSGDTGGLPSLAPGAPAQ
ncbi:OmpH family outer membrane protein [Paracoccus sp. S-4012]|uniref:OmpH family outer membrane protein n=1 Tax=Paracoccus sp. S-4012 TaxID=2665648 RepID=UPI0012B06374|nr:OmpH family outer membrane protein [Paracoccus sp. S-4012]MRX49605.1 OmpH family outer membrane protein [Paracoccus sp. S-4012]